MWVGVPLCVCVRAFGVCVWVCEGVGVWGGVGVCGCVCVCMCVCVWLGRVYCSW